MVLKPHQSIKLHQLTHQQLYGIGEGEWGPSLLIRSYVNNTPSVYSTIISFQRQIHEKGNALETNLFVIIHSAFVALPRSINTSSSPLSVNNKLSG